MTNKNSPFCINLFQIKRVSLDDRFFIIESDVAPKKGDLLEVNEESIITIKTVTQEDDVEKLGDNEWLVGIE